MTPKDIHVSSKLNAVLQDGHRTSGNFYESDRIFHDFLAHELSKPSLGYMESRLQRLGMVAATEMDELSLIADKKTPELIKRDRYGELKDEIRFHPAYDRLMEIAVESEMMRVKWEPALRDKFGYERHRLGFAAGYLFSMAESGQYCPLCMTDGVALLIDRFAKAEDRDRLLPRIYTTKPKEFFTGAMFLTEKAGGSDVGANLMEARAFQSDRYTLHGEKWFCSNVNADIIFALARTDPERLGTRGLSIFLVERFLANGKRNHLNIVRLKDKLGTRSMASAECQLDGTVGRRIGEEFEGFRIMTEMINLSRLYNAVAALAGGRRALVEAYQFLTYRKSFRKIALEHALVRSKLWELGTLHLVNFHLVWRTIRALDRAENGDAAEQQLLRLLTPMAKRDSAEIAVYLARESMELMGGLGYVEDTVMPKIMRDVMVLPIWEGAGNIMILDMLRALRKSEGLKLMLREVEFAARLDNGIGEAMMREVTEISEKLKKAMDMEQDAMEYLAKDLLLRLTRWYQIALLLKARNDRNEDRINLALAWLMRAQGPEWATDIPPAPDSIHTLIGWEF